MENSIGLKQDDILTSNDVLDLLKISRPTLYRIRKSGRLKSYKVRGKVYFKRSELFKFIESGLEN